MKVILLFFALSISYSNASAARAVTFFCIFAVLAAIVAYGVLTPAWWKSWRLWPKGVTGWVAFWLHTLEFMLFALVTALRIFPISIYDEALSGGL
jgi:hypothetical protein